MMKKLLIIFCLVLFSLKALSLDVVFRYDDYRLVPDDFQSQLIETFASEQVPLHIAIIPFDKDSIPMVADCPLTRRTIELQKAGILQIALHGYQHIGETIQGEFLNKSFLEQQDCLQKGSRLLDSIFNTHVHIFIPPWNRYNQDTQNILYNLGYNIISADMADCRFVLDKRFQYYPEGVDHPQKLLNVINHNAEREGLVVCMFHRYDITDSFTFDDLQNILQQVKTTKGMHITTMDELYQCDSTFDGQRLLANTIHPLLSKIISTRSIILPINEVLKIRVIDLCLHAILFFILSLVVLFIRPIDYKYWLIQIPVIILSLFCVWQQWLMPKLAIIVCSAVVILMAFLSIYLRKLKH